MSQNDSVNLKTLKVCFHCGDEIGVTQKYCKQCALIAGRRELCANNYALNKNYVCPMRECVLA